MSKRSKPNKRIGGLAPKEGSTLQELERLSLAERERLSRLEADMSTTKEGVSEIKRLIYSLVAELKSTFVPRGESEERLRGVDARHDRQDARLRDLETNQGRLQEQILAINGRPAPTPAWVTIVGSLLIGLVSLLGGTLIGVLMSR